MNLGLAEIKSLPISIQIQIFFIWKDWTYFFQQSSFKKILLSLPIYFRLLSVYSAT